MGATVPALHFVQLNEGWNAEPNAPEVTIVVAGSTLRVEFDANAFQYPEYAEGERLSLEFADTVRYRLGPTNDEGWCMGQCRFGRAAPSWGEFYRWSEIWKVSPSRTTGVY